MTTIEIIEMCEGMKGISRNPDYFTKLRIRLNGNIAMEGVDDFQLTQISWEAKDLLLDDIIANLRHSIDKDKEIV